MVLWIMVKFTLTCKNQEGFRLKQQPIMQSINKIKVNSDLIKITISFKRNPILVGFKKSFIRLILLKVRNKIKENLWGFTKI